MSNKIMKGQKQDRTAEETPRETSKKDPVVTVALIAQTAGVVIAIIGCISAVLVALLDSPLITPLIPLTSTVTASVTSTGTAIPPTFTEVLPSATWLSTETSIPSATATLTFTPSPTPVPPKMVIKPWANRYGGEVPLNIQFSVNGSYVEFADGSRSYCSSGACRYTWSVFFVGLNRTIATPQPWQETFGFTFSRVGLYRVIVKVCQGDDICDEKEIQIEGR